MAQPLKFLLIPLAMLASVVVLALVFHGMGDSYSRVMYAVMLMKKQHLISWVE